MFESNRKEVIEFAKEVKQKFPLKTIWLYTGYQWHEIIEDPTMSDIVKHVDVICDGKYIDELRDIDKHWVGSSNQNVIDVKKRIQTLNSLI